jgi:hypothetical protein
MWRTMATRGFRQVRVSVRITTLRHVFLVYYDLLGGDPLYPSFYIPRGVVFTRKDQVSYSCIRSGLYLYLSIYKIYLMIIFKPPRLWASWHGSLGRVGRLMVPPPHSFSSSLLDVLSKVPNLIRARAEILDHQLQRIFTASRCRCRNIGNVSKGESFKYILQMHFPACNKQLTTKHFFTVYGSLSHSTSDDS